MRFIGIDEGIKTVLKVIKTILESDNVKKRLATKDKGHLSKNILLQIHKI